MKRWSIFLSCIFFLTISLAGCGEPERACEITNKSAISPITLPTQYHIIGWSVANRPIICQVFGDGPDVTLIMATIHGNEPAGTPLVRHLASYLEHNKYILSGRTVVLIPVANPDGMIANTRENKNGIDLNRNFMAGNRVNNDNNGDSAMSEPESKVLYDALHKYKPDRIVSIHQRLACIDCAGIDYDGPASSLANHMERYCILPVKRLGAKPGSLGSYAGVTLGIPIITFEMLQSDSDLTELALWEKYGKAMLAAIEYPDNP